MGGYKPVVGVRAFLVEDQTGGSATAKSESLLPTLGFSLSLLQYNSCCSGRGLQSQTVSTEGKKKLDSRRAATCMLM